MKQDFQFPAMKRFRFPAIINDILLICTYLLLEALSTLPAAFIRLFDAVESRLYALRRAPAAITLPFDDIRLKPTGCRIHCRSAFGYDAKGAY